MGNPLNKRYPRMLRHDFGRYCAIFLMISVCIGLVSGFLVAASSIEKIFNEMPQTYSIEDGRFETKESLPEAAVAAAEEHGATIRPSFSHDSTYEATDGTLVTMRSYENRTELNRAAIHEGAVPANDSEIAIDQTFASKRGIEVGDQLLLGDQEFTVSGLVTLPDYGALFKSNSDFMMDTVTFCVATVTSEGFERLASDPIHYTYSYTFHDEGLSVADRTDIETEMMKALSDEGGEATELIDALDNQGITYAGDDVTHDQAIYEVLLALIIVIMALIFVITTNSSIEAESSVIGTLLASGYSRSELIRHYLFLPTAIGLVACIVGNVAGYAFLSDPMKSLYYNSYSFPPYVASFNLKVFLITTVIPFGLLVGISFWGIARKLNCTPLQFLRHDITRKSRRHNLVLPARLSYPTRFRLHVFIRNLPHFATLFAGIAFASLLLIFGLALLPVMENYAGTLAQTVPAQHVYTLKAPYELEMTDEQQSVRDEIAELERLQAALDELKGAGGRLKSGSSTLAGALGAATSGSTQLSGAISGQLASGTRTLSEGTDAYASALNASAQQQEALSASSSTAAEQQAYAAALQGYLKAYAAALAAGTDPAQDSATTAAYGQLQGALTSLVQKAGQVGGHAGAAEALRGAAAGLNQLSAGTDALDAAVSGQLAPGAATLAQGMGQLETGYGQYAQGVDGYTDAVTLLIDSAAEMLESDDASDGIANRYHTVAEEGSNSQEAIDASEKIAVTQLEIRRTSTGDYETITVYGIQENSRYWDGINVTDDRIVAGAGLAKKCGAQPGTVGVFYDKYTDTNYAIPVSDANDNLTDTNLYLSISRFNELFGNDSTYFNGYVSDQELAIDPDFLATHITPENMQRIGTQMTDSMGSVVKFVVFLSVFIFFVVIYLLTKTAIEHSARSISYMKVFGYLDREISKLYVRSITLTVAASLLISLPLVCWSVIQLCEMMLVSYSGNFVIEIPAHVLAADVVIGMAMYALVALLHLRQIKKIPLSLALKVTE